MPLMRALLLSCVLVLVGCGGGGGGSFAQSSLVGSYEGGWTDSTGGHGPIWFTISADKQLSGGFTDFKDGEEDGTLLGEVEKSGDVSTLWRYDNLPHYELTGSVDLANDHETLTGTLTDGSITWEVELFRQ